MRSNNDLRGELDACKDLFYDVFLYLASIGRKFILNFQFSILNFFFIAGMMLVACNKEKVSDPYQPVTLSHINRLDLISGNDSSILIFDAGMVLTSGKNNTVNPKGYEWFTMKYADVECQLLTGAEYNVANDPAGHRTERAVTYSLDKRNMLSKVTREDWASKSFSLSYDAQFRLIQLTFNDLGAVNRYTIAYDDRSNVSSVELYQKASNVEGTEKHEFLDYDSNTNPFYFLVNVFYAPVLSSNNGVIFFDKLSKSLGVLLSKNNPRKVVRYLQNGKDWEEIGTSSYSYEYGENNRPVSIAGEGLSLKIEYH